jgi:hypothetical protein
MALGGAAKMEIFFEILEKNYNLQTGLDVVLTWRNKKYEVT